MRKIFRIYFGIFKITWKSITDYRFNFLFGLICSFIPIIALTILWNVIYEDVDNISKYTKEMMIAYIIYAKFLNIIIVPEFFFDIMDEIQNGTMTTYLSKPVNYILCWFFRALGKKTKNIVLSIIPMILIGTFYCRVIMDKFNFIFFIAFIFVLILAYILYFLLFMIVALLSFWFYDISGWYYTITLSIELLAGVIIPISLFPFKIREILEYLPFKYLINFPINILIKNVENDGLWLGIKIQFLWIFILLLVLKILWKMGIKRYEANGG